MDGISSTAAVLQLVTQAVALIQDVYEVREAIQAAPKTLEDLRQHLMTVEHMVNDVQNEPRLRTRPIMAIVARIMDIAQELVLILHALERLGRRSKFYQSAYLLIKRHRDEARLNGVMGRLETAKSDLGIKLQVATFATTTEMATDVQRMGRTIELAVKRDSRQNMPRMEDNMVSENSHQVNAIVGTDVFGAPMTASIVRNAATGNSCQRNLIFGFNAPVEKVY